MWKSEDKAPWGLYIHIPFCQRKCLYCDFLSFQASEEVQKIYCESLRKELAMWAEDPRVRNRKTDTVFFGGGTPSLLNPRLFTPIMDDICRYFSLTKDAEISLECNPGVTDKEKFSLYRSLGVNRISIGMQSMVDTELQALGRIHRAEEFLEAYAKARECGFDNINIDLMAAIPGQTLDSYCETLRKVIDLEPEHISSYSLILEKGTPFYEKYRECPPVSEETDRIMYEQTEILLSDAGYERYEISNYARPGKECRHNLKYWRRQEYVGAGVGAASFLCEERIFNERDLTAYQTSISRRNLPVAEKELLLKEDAMAEFMFLGLRCMQGVSERAFYEKFGITMSERYGDVIKKYSDLAMLKKKGDQLMLTARGIDVSNVIFADFL